MKNCGAVPKKLYPGEICYFLKELGNTYRRDGRHIFLVQKVAVFGTLTITNKLTQDYLESVQISLDLGTQK